MKIVVLGNGFLGSEFKALGYNVLGIDEFKLNKYTSDASGKEPLEKLKEYDVVINCIGISDTRFCEDRKNFAEALFANGEIPKVLSSFCNENGIRFVHISTGCLYDEAGRPCTEEDLLAAHCGYTITKYVGEQGCNPDKDIILRPRLLFSDKKQASRNNLVQKLLAFNTFVDELNSVTWNKTIVEATMALLKANATGIFNVANEGRHTIYEIATKMLGRKGTKMSGAELRTSQGLYLVNNVMDLTKLKKHYQPPTVEKAIAECLIKLKEEG